MNDVCISRPRSLWERGGRGGGGDASHGALGVWSAVRELVCVAVET